MFYMSAGFMRSGPPTPTWRTVASSCSPFARAIWVALGTNLIGMKIGKWTENVGAAATWVWARCW